MVAGVLDLANANGDDALPLPLTLSIQFSDHLGPLEDWILNTQTSE